MEFGRDAKQAASNLRKHGVHFADAGTVLYDNLALMVPDDHPSEQGFVTIGVDARGRLLVVAYTWRGECAGLISARRAAAV
ncbi:MAG: BrnT family toxin [Candidatus Methylomirabilales bacterium]